MVLIQGDIRFSIPEHQAERATKKSSFGPFLLPSIAAQPQVKAP